MATTLFGIHETTATWAKQLRALSRDQTQASGDDAAFYGPFTLIVTDQGVRGYLHVLNDLCFVRAPHLDLRSWRMNTAAAASDAMAVTDAIKSLRKHAVASFLQDIAEGLATFDWRTSAAPGISDDERRKKLVFRGSSGYKELRAQLLEHLKERGGVVGEASERLI